MHLPQEHLLTVDIKEESLILHVLHVSVDLSYSNQDVIGLVAKIMGKEEHEIYLADKDHCGWSYPGSFRVTTDIVAAHARKRRHE